jgi:hypothetical protein
LEREEEHSQLQAEYDASTSVENHKRLNVRGEFDLM